MYEAPKFGTTGYQNIEMAPYKPFMTGGSQQNVSDSPPLNRPAYNVQPNSTQTYGSAVDNAGTAVMGASGGNPYAVAAGGALKVGGSIMQIYGAYKAREDAKKQYARDLKQWESSERERKGDKARQLKRDEVSQGYLASNFAQNLESNLTNKYPGYRTGR